MNAAPTTMWEVRAAAGALDELIAWVRAEVLPGLRAVGTAEAYAAADERLVVIATGPERAARLPDPPAHLVRRPPHQWSFRRLDV